MSVQISYKKQTIFSILLVIIAFVIVEFFSIIYTLDYQTCTFTDKEPFAIHDPKSVQQICDDYLNLEREYTNTYFQVPPNQYSETLSINNFSFRSLSDTMMEKPSNTFRIIVLGGSTIFGVGASSDATTIPAYLERELNNTFSSPIEVINSGYPSGNSRTESELVKNVLLDFEPDMIIVYDGWNDIQQPLDQLEFAEKSLAHSFLTYVLSLFPDYKTPIMVSEIGAKIFHRNPTIDYDDTFVSQKVQLWKNNWSEVCESSKINNFEMIFFIQPILGTGDKPLTDGEKEILDSDPSNKVQALGLSKFVSAMNEFKHCSQTFDLTNIFDQTSEAIYFDQGHMTDNGNLIVAKKMSELINPIIKNNI